MGATIPLLPTRPIADEPHLARPTTKHFHRLGRRLIAAGEPVRLVHLSDTQLGVLLLAWHGPLRQTPRGWRADGSDALIARHTFRVMVELGLLNARQDGSGTQMTATLTAAGYTLADLAVTLSREIASAVAGLPARLPIEAKVYPGEDVPS